MPQWLTNFFDWVVGNLLWDFFKGVSLSLIGLLFIWLWKKFVGKPVPKGKKLSFFLILFLGGSVLITALLAIIGNRNDEGNSPKLSVECLAYTTGNPPIESQKALSNGKVGTAVTFVLKVVNGGSPTIAWKWNLSVRLINSGKIIDAPAVENPINIRLVSNENNPPISLEASRYLPNALLENPLPNGAAKKGWVTFLVPEVSQQDLEHVGNIYTIRFEDCKGRITTISKNCDSSTQTFY